MRDLVRFIVWMVADLFRSRTTLEVEIRHGIDVDVGPVTGWLPPMAPNRKLLGGPIQSGGASDDGSHGPRVS